jgi:hypothetical protein
MPSAIELHDSTVRSCIEAEGDVTICLSPAILHRSSGLAGRDAGEVFTIDLYLILHDATIIEPFADFPTTLLDGSVNVANQFYGNCIPFPFDVIALISVEFIDEHGRSTRITAARLTLTAVSDEKYLESFPGTGG